MDNPRRRLMDAAIALLADRPAHEPTTRELCAGAGVTAPSLYHHFGDKDGLLAVVLEEAFEDYLAHKRDLARSGDLLRDFAAGWEMHLQFGLDNPLLYPAMFASPRGRGEEVSRRAVEELRCELAELEQAGLLRVPLDDAVSLTLAASIGCVLQLLREEKGVDSSLSGLALEALLHQLCGTSGSPEGPGGAARSLLAGPADLAAELGHEEAALLRKWLTLLARPGEPDDSAR